jgi:hypothetical protein
MLTLSARRTSTDTGGRIELLLEGPNVAPQLQAAPIFFELLGSEISDLPVLDGFVGGLLHHLMEDRQDLHVEGRLSKTSLRNLAAYQHFWSLVQPNRCSPIRITADEIVADHGDTRGLPAVANYSGGIDSAFTVARHSLQLCGMESVPPRAVMIVHGFDVRLANDNGFARLLDRLQPVIEEYGLKRYVVRTNLKEMGLQNWVDSYSAQLVACLHAVSHQHSTALLASDGYGQMPVFEYGGNPISVPLLGSSRLKVLYDGGQFGRTDKVELIAKYPHLRRSLKFCWEGPDPDLNCGRCRKCFLTYMNFRAVGIENPECFDAPISAEMIGNFGVQDNAVLILGYEVLEHLWKVPALASLMDRFSAPFLRFERETGAYGTLSQPAGTHQGPQSIAPSSRTPSSDHGGFDPSTQRERRTVAPAAIVALNGGKVTYEDDLARIEADPNTWSYSAALQSAAFAGMAGPARIEIRLQADRGAIGVLVLRRGSWKDAVAREQCAGSWRSKAVTLAFNVPRIENVGDVVFRGWPGESTGRATVFSVDVLTERRWPSLRGKLRSLSRLWK